MYSTGSDGSCCCCLVEGSAASSVQLPLLLAAKLGDAASLPWSSCTHSVLDMSVLLYGLGSSNF